MVVRPATFVLLATLAAAAAGAGGWLAVRRNLADAAAGDGSAPAPAGRVHPQPAVPGGRGGGNARGSAGNSGARAGGGTGRRHTARTGPAGDTRTGCARHAGSGNGAAGPGGSNRSRGSAGNARGSTGYRAARAGGGGVRDAPGQPRNGAETHAGGQRGSAAGGCAASHPRAGCRLARRGARLAPRRRLGAIDEARRSAGQDPLPVEEEELVISADAVIGLQVETTVSSAAAEVEDDVNARVTRDVMAGDRVAIPAGTPVRGSVVLVEQAGKLRGQPRLGVRFHTAVMDDGAELRLATETVYREGTRPRQREHAAHRRRRGGGRHSRRHLRRAAGRRHRQRRGRGGRHGAGRGPRRPAGQLPGGRQGDDSAPESGHRAGRSPASGQPLARISHEGSDKRLPIMA